MKVHVVSGSRADRGLLAWPIRLLAEADMLVGATYMRPSSMAQAHSEANRAYDEIKADVVMLLGDRWEILAAATAAHLRRLPIAHIAGGDVTLGSYDDAMRDCISRMASVHFVTSTSAMARLTHMGLTNVHLVGNPGVDYIKHGPWKSARPIDGPYVVVAYYPETIDDTVDLEAVHAAIGGRSAVWISSNADRGVDRLPPGKSYEHDEFLNLIYHCEEFIGNSSSLIYEAPELGVKTRMIGKRQKGRTIPWGDGNASKRIVNILKYAAL